MKEWIISTMIMVLCVILVFVILIYTKKGDCSTENFVKNVMKISLKNINYYYLNCPEKEDRKNQMENEFADYNLYKINPVMNLSKYQSATIGVSKILDYACQKQDKDKPFEPFILLEDDVKKYREWPDEIEAPDNVDILYVGLSKCGWDGNRNTWCLDVCYKHVDENLIRIFNMLSTHGYMICSLRGLVSVQKAMFESYFKDIPWDIPLAQLQPHLNVYALKKPLVYQDSSVGGVEDSTRFEITDKDDHHIDPSWINKDNISILTMK